jgi:hypothetical protein
MMGVTHKNDDNLLYLTPRVTPLILTNHHLPALATDGEKPNKLLNILGFIANARH